MLKRSDLSKQFELVVQQEIKNFQDVSYQINQALNEMRNRLDHLEKSTSSTQSLSESRHKSLSIEVEALRSDYNKTDKRLDMHIGVMDYSFQRAQDEIENNTYNICTNSNRIDSTQNEIDKLKKSFDSIGDQVEEYAKVLASSLGQIQLDSSKKISNFMAEILDLIPDELAIVRKDLEEKMSSHKIDVEGILKEIRIIGKRVMVTEKNIENIYSIIKDKQKLEVVP